MSAGPALRPHPQPHFALGKRGFLLATLAAVYAWSAWGTGFNFRTLAAGVPDFLRLMAEMWPPNLAIAGRLVGPLQETVQIALVGTSFGALLAVPVVLLAARNVTRNPYVYYAARSVMNLLRTIPELLYASILVAVVGIGPFAGVLALTVFSLAVIAKLSSESLEAIDPGPLEAIEAAGGSWLQVIGFAVVPQALPAFMSHTLYVFEVNIRVSTVLGLVGAGGIGTTLQTSLNLFSYRSAAAIILATFVFVAAIDFVSTRIRARLV